VTAPTAPVSPVDEKELHPQERMGNNYPHDRLMWDLIDEAVETHETPRRDVLESFAIYVRRYNMTRFMQLNRADREHGGTIYRAARRVTPIHELAVHPKLTRVAKSLMATETLILNGILAVAATRPSRTRSSSSGTRTTRSSRTPRTGWCSGWPSTTSTRPTAGCA
jgi:hypothetical protein